jgi:pyruvate dehydrogenase E2 component (dihydrolipoamide acetyltransferase)
MAEFLMPTLGADMSVGILSSWLKKPGDTVQRGDIIAVVHTDKADVEVETFASGVIERMLVEPGSEVPVGTPLAVIRESGEAEPTAASEQEARLMISPSARELAHELGVDPAEVRGSGPGGRIQRKDVEAAAAARDPARPPPSAPRPAVAPQAPAAAPSADDRGAAMRRAIGAAMSRSKREIPHFYLGHTIDLSRAMSWLTESNVHRSVSERLLHGVLLLKAVALALSVVPELNATWQGDEVVRHDDVNIGVAIALRGGGLVAPAIRHTDELSLDELMHAFRDLVTRARRYSLRSSEISAPTITVTSLGERTVDTVFGVIFPPQVAIVGFGAVVERLWVSDGQVLPCPVVSVSLSADHRVTDGHRASAFLVALDRLLQEPEEL